MPITAGDAEPMNRRIETVLEAFIKSEITTTDNRISAIRVFVDTLKAELLSYTNNINTDPGDKEYFTMVLRLFKSMIATYDDEIQILMAKRAKMLDHLLGIRSVVTQLRPLSDTPSNIHIN